MPISLLEQKKKQKFLLPILGVIILITLIVILRGFFKKPSIVPSSSISIGQKINIDWDTLKSPILETLESFDVIPPLSGSYGRKNPFLPY